MCDPLSITLGAVSLAGVASNAIGQHKAKKANDREAEKAYRQNINDLNARSAEEIIASTAQENAVAKQAQSSAALARVSAAEAGVTGASVDAQQHTIEADQGAANTAIEQNLTATLRQIDRMKRGQLSELASRKNAVQDVDPLALGLQIGGVGLDAFSRFLIKKPKVG